MTKIGKGFLCRRCGEIHRELPLSYAVEAPGLWYELSDEQSRRSRLTAATCVIDEKAFFVAGSVKIPIAGTGQVLAWDVWVEVSRDDFQRFESLARGNPLPPIPGRLASEIPVYFPSTYNLQATVHATLPGARPIIELAPDDHPLVQEQRQGIIWERVQRIAELILHGPETPPEASATGA